MFFFLAISMLTLIYGFFGIRTIKPAAIDLKWKLLLWGILLLFYAAIPIAIHFRFNASDNPAGILLTWLAYLSLGFFTLTFPVLVFRDILYIVYQSAMGIVALVRRFTSPVRDEMPKNPSRRSFLINSTNLAILGMTSSLTLYGLAEAMSIPDVVSVDISLKNLPPQFDGFRILQITDLHVSMTVRRKYIQAVVDRANTQKADMIVLTGDLADGRVIDLRSEVAPLAELTAEFGKFFVTGNHEYYSGVGPWLAESERLGFTPLINEHRIIQRRGAGIVLAGITDYRAARILPSHASNPKTALAGTPEDMPKILLAHQPISIFQAEQAGADLMISGHTHGGQYIPWNLFVSLFQPYLHGLHKHGETQLYVSRGTGHWGPPIRIGAPSEITVLRLFRKQD